MARGNAKTAQGSYAAAIADCDRAIALDPDLALPYVNRGITRVYLDDCAGAAEDYWRADALSIESVLAPEALRTFYAAKERWSSRWRNTMAGRCEPQYRPGR